MVFYIARKDMLLHKMLHITRHERLFIISRHDGEQRREAAHQHSNSDEGKAKAPLMENNDDGSSGHDNDAESEAKEA